jgi:hypothetical protein
MTRKRKIKMRKLSKVSIVEEIASRKRGARALRSIARLWRRGGRIDDAELTATIAFLINARKGRPVDREHKYRMGQIRDGVEYRCRETHCTKAEALRQVLIDVPDPDGRLFKYCLVELTKRKPTTKSHAQFAS